MPVTNQLASGSADRIISQYLAAQLTSKEQALIIAQSQAPELFQDIATDFVRLTKLIQRWYASPTHVSLASHHHGLRIQQLLHDEAYQPVRTQRLPTLQGEEEVQTGLLVELLQLNQSIKPHQATFRKRGQQLHITLSVINLPTAYQEVFSLTQPLPYVLNNLSNEILTAYLMRRDLERAGITPFFNQHFPDRLQLRLICLEQLHLPF